MYDSIWSWPSNIIQGHCILSDHRHPVKKHSQIGPIDKKIYMYSGQWFFPHINIKIQYQMWRSKQNCRNNNLAFTTTLLYILYMSPSLMRIEYDVMKIYWPSTSFGKMELINYNLIIIETYFHQILNKYMNAHSLN